MVIQLHHACVEAATAIRAALLIQRWYRQYVARLEMRRRCTWNIFQSIEYAGQQDQIKLKAAFFNWHERESGVPWENYPVFKLYNFFSSLLEHFTQASSENKLINHLHREKELCADAEWEREFCYKSIEVPASYSGPHLTFPVTFCAVSKLVEAFRHKHKLHARYVLQLLGETWRLLKILPNINHISTHGRKEITICGDLHGQLEDLLLIFYKNGLPSPEKPYVFNGDFVDRGKHSLEILLILFGFQLLYPNDVHLNRGNHEDHIVNLRYGFTKEVLLKYRIHGKRILKLLQKIFSSLPLAALIDKKVLVVHGGISDTTDLNIIAKLDRHRYVSTLRPPKSSHHTMWWTNTSQTGDQRDGRPRVYSLNHQSSCRGQRRDLRRRSLHNLTNSSQPKCSLEKELKRRRRLAGFHQAYGETQKCDSGSDPECGETTDEEEWKQIVDLLWSDPMPQNGCIPNEVRGGGCYWGPDVTAAVLGRHKLQTLIRSHECKQDGYEYCHNHRVLTIFSASNYYEVGSNRGAYIRLGPDLMPHLIQYQAGRACTELTLRQSVGWAERSALRALREQLFIHKSELIAAFKELDPNHTGTISLGNWVGGIESVLKLCLPWRVLRPQLVRCTQQGLVNYPQWIKELSITEPKLEICDTSILETLYKNHSNLEAIFRIIDTDQSGLISLEEFQQTWKLLSSHLKTELSNEAIAHLAQSIDFNKDGSIDINEFMEAFRLVDIPS